MSGKSVVGCKWVFAIKVGLDGTIDHFKARLLAISFTQIFCLDYWAKMVFVRLFIAMVGLQQWPLY